MKLSHTRAATSAVFDDPNLVSAAGLVPVLALADAAGLARLAGEHLSVPGDKGANAGLKVASLVAGMAAGADSIDDMALLRHGGMGRVFDRAYAPSTLSSFLRAFTFGHVRQLDALAARFLTNLTDHGSARGRVLVDVDDTIIEVHGHAKQGAGFGYSGVRGLNALLATVTTTGSAPVIVAQRLRKGSCGSPRGAKRLVADALSTVRTLHGHPSVKPLLRADSAFYRAPTVGAALRGGAEVSVTCIPLLRPDGRVTVSSQSLNPGCGASPISIVVPRSTAEVLPLEYLELRYNEPKVTFLMNRIHPTVAALTAALALAGCGSAAETTSTKGETTSAVVSGEGVATESSDGQAEDVAEASAQLKVSDYGFTQLPKSDFGGPSVSYAVIVTNEGGAIATNAQVQISFEDQAGGVVDSQEDYLTAVLPGTSVALGGDVPDAAGVKKMTVQVLPGDSEPLEGKAANFEVTNIKTKAQEYTGVKTTASVNSPFVKDVKDAKAVAVYRNAKGKIIGGDFTFINFIPAGGKAAVSIDSFSQKKVPAKTEVYVALSGLSLLE